MLCRSPFGGEGRPFSAGEEGIWKMTRLARGCARLLRRGGLLLGARGPGLREIARRDVKAGVRPGGDARGKCARRVWAGG